MGYYANGGGNIEFINTLCDDKQKRIEEILEYDGFEFEFYGSRKQNNITIGINIWFDNKYHGDSIEEGLNKIREIADIRDGCIEFHGEDGCYWRFLYDPPERRWREQTGHIVYYGVNEEAIS